MQKPIFRKSTSKISSEKYAYGKYYRKLNMLARLVEQKSKEVNITAIRDYESILEKHVKDSLTITKIDIVSSLLSQPKIRVLDVGSGGGFPGLPLAIIYPHASFTLLDSTKKKTDVIKEFVDELGLLNVKVVWGRAENLKSDKKYKESFDMVIARSVAYLSDLLVLLEPFLSKNGFIIAYKVSDKDELSSGKETAARLHLKEIKRFEYEIGSSERVILVYQRK